MRWGEKYFQEIKPCEILNHPLDLSLLRQVGESVSRRAPVRQDLDVYRSSILAVSRLVNSDEGHGWGMRRTGAGLFLSAAHNDDPPTPSTLSSFPCKSMSKLALSCSTSLHVTTTCVSNKCVSSFCHASFPAWFLLARYESFFEWGE